MFSPEFLSFLVRAKQATYASGIAPDSSSRPASHDLTFRQEPYLYIDSYLGGFHFIGEEAVWQEGKAIWGMNYYGKSLTSELPEGFGDFLKAALRQIPEHSPYRGPSTYVEGAFTYQCWSSGELTAFNGEEVIFHRGVLIYRLHFHGGEIL